MIYTYIKLFSLEVLLEIILLALETKDEIVQLLRLLRQLGGVRSVDVQRFDPLLEDGSLLFLQLLL